MRELKPSSSTRVGRSCGLVFGILWTSFSCFFLVSAIGFFQGDAEISWVIIPFLLVPLVFMLVGMGIITGSVLPWIAGMRVAKPEVSISSTSLRVGDGFTFGFSQTFKQKTDVKGVRLSLILRERATYQQGTDTRTVTHEETVEEYQYPERVYETGDQLFFSRGMRIPRGAMHTFRSRHNQITWQVRVEADFAGWPDYRENFDIQVRPSEGG